MARASALVLTSLWPWAVGGALPPFTPVLRDLLWEQAHEEVAKLPPSAYTNSEHSVCAAGVWGDSGQVNQWDQGFSPCWPSTLSISATWDVQLMARWSVELAREFGEPNRGQLGPGVNLARFAWNGRLGEYMSGEDPYLGARMIAAQVTAYRQVDRPAIQVVKHWIPNTIETDRAGMTEVVDERTLFEVYYPPFAAAVDAGVSAVMCSYNLVNCTTGRCTAGAAYACANDDILNKHLKETMGFKGIVMSDWDATKCQDEAADSGGCLRGGYVDKDFAAEAGLDLEMPACMAFSGGVTKRAQEKATRMRWAYLVQGRSFDGQGRRLEADAQGGALRGQQGTRKDRGSHQRGFCCWWPLPARDVCKVCTSRDQDVARDTCKGTGTWCHGNASAALEQSSHPPADSPAPAGNWLSGVYNDNPFGYASPSPGVSSAGDQPATVTLFGKETRLCPHEGGDNYKSPCKLALAARIIAESTVVLKNDGGILPLSKRATVALVGSQACSTDPLATGGGSGWNGFACNQVPKINVRDGIAGLEDGPALLCPDTSGSNAAADSADVVLAVVSPAKANEGQDRETLQLSKEDVELIRKYAARGKKVVVAMNAPGPMITSTWDGNVSALVVSWLPGQQNGRGIARALYNEGNEASGRLPFTFPKCSTSECSLSDERSSVALGDQIESKAYRVFSEKALIGYRWYHAQRRSVSYPFGFGLFAYGSAEVEYSGIRAMRTPSGISITCRLHHAGPRAGHDVPQLYVSFPSSIPGDANSKPEWVLKGFAKVHVRPHAPVTVSFDLSPRDLSYWDDAPGRSLWVCAVDRFRACVGANARDAIIEGKGVCTTFESPCVPHVERAGLGQARGQGPLMVVVKDDEGTLGQQRPRTGGAPLLAAAAAAAAVAAVAGAVAASVMAALRIRARGSLPASPASGTPELLALIGGSGGATVA